MEANQVRIQQFVIVAVLSLLIIIQRPHALTIEHLGIWLLCLGVYLLALRLAGPIKNGAWTAYVMFPVLVTWLVLGGGFAYALLLVGFAAMPRFPGGDLQTGLRRTFVLLTGLLVAQGIYAGGLSLIRPDAASDVVITTPEHITVMLVALAAAFLAGRVTVWLLLKNRSAAWLRLYDEPGMLAFTSLMVVIYDRIGLIAFTAGAIIAVTQIIRYYQMIEVKTDLEQRLQEISLLSATSRRISQNLAVKDVLQSVYDVLHTTIPLSQFITALYDIDSQIVRFPLVIRHGQPQEWPAKHIETEPFLAQSFQKMAVQHIRRGEHPEFDSLFAGLPDDDAHQLFISIPLQANAHYLGIIGLIPAGGQAVVDRVLGGMVANIANQTTLALHNALTYERSVRLGHSLNTINRSVQDVMFNLDDRDALASACKTAQEIALADGVAIFLTDKEQDSGARLAHANGLTDEHQHLYTSPVYIPAIFREEPYIVSDISQLSERDTLTELAQAGQFQAVAEIPMKSGGAPIGLMCLFHRTPHYYHQSEIEMLGTLAYQITAALDYTDLLSSLELYASEQAQLVHLSRISTASLDLNAIINDVLRILERIAEVDRAEIGLVDDGNLNIIGLERQLTQRMESIPELQTQPGKKINRGQVYYASDADLSPAMMELMYDSHHLAIVPMVANKNLVGVMLLGKVEEDNFTDAAWRLVEMASNLLASQFYNAQIYHNTQNELQRRLQQLAFIEKIAQQITRLLSLDKIIDNVLQVVITATGANTAALGLLVEDNNFRVILREYYAQQWSRHEFIHHASEGGLVNEVIHTGRLCVVSDNQAYPKYLPLEYYSTTYRSSLVIPLIEENRVIGIINLESDQPDYFNGEHIDFVNNIAGHTVISIQNSRMLQERQTQVEMFTQLYALSASLSIDTNEDSIVEQILQTAVTLVNGQAAFLYKYGGGQLDLLDQYITEQTGYTVPEALLQQIIQTGDFMVDYPTGEPCEVLFIVPMHRSSAGGYLLCVTLARKRADLHGEQNALQLLALQASGHLVNATLYHQIHTASNRMRTILDSTRDGIILLDQYGNLVDSNISAHHLLNVNLPAFQGESFVDVLRAHLPADSGFSEMTDRLKTNTQRSTTVSYSIEEDNLTRHIEQFEAPVMDSSRRVMGRLLTLRDVTEEKMLAAYRDEITQMVIHDLRGPLSSIISSISLTLEIAEDSTDTVLKETVQSVMNVSMETAMGLLKLVESLLDIAKMESRRMPLSREAVQITDLIADVFKTLSATANQNRVTLETDITTELPLVHVDEEKIRRVITNIVDNAIRFTPPEGKVLVTASRNGSQKLIVRIADSGPGIPPEDVENVFEKFRQIKANIPISGGKGFGLGLTFCKLAIEAHGELLWIEQNSPLSGACFAFTLPLYQPGAQRPAIFDKVTSKP